MARFIISIFSVFVLSISFSFNSKAEFEIIPRDTGVYVTPDGVNVVPGENALEAFWMSQINPNLECPGRFENLLEILVSLRAGDTDSLYVDTINPVTGQIIQQERIDLDSSIFGLTRNAYTRDDGTSFGSFINGGDQNGGDLEILRILDEAVDLLEVDPGTNTYGETTTAPMDLPGEFFFFDADPCIGAPDTATDEFKIFCSPDNGDTWIPDAVVEDVLSALEGGTVGTFGPTGLNSFWVFAAATTNVEYTLSVTDTLTGMSKTFDTDNVGGGLKDSCGVSTEKGSAVAYNNIKDNMTKVVIFPNNFGQPFGGGDPVVIDLGPLPDFNGTGELGFTGLGCGRELPNPNGTEIGIIGPDGKRWDIDLDLNKIFTNVTPTPTKNTQSGPAAFRSFCTDLGGPDVNPIFADGFESGDLSSWTDTEQSIFFAQYIYTEPSQGIPTLNQWGLISLGLILLIIGAFYLRRRKSRA